MKLNAVITRLMSRVPPPRMSHVLSLTNACSWGVIRVEPLSPPTSMNHAILAMAIPPKMPFFTCERPLKVNITRASHCVMKPKTKAMATLRKMPMMTLMAFSVLMRSPNVSRWPAESVAPCMILTKAMANAPPSNSNTILTVVDVGIPMLLNTSSSNTSVSMTAMKMHITS